MLRTLTVKEAIERLDRARELDKLDLSGVQAITPEAAEVLLDWPRMIVLPDLVSLTTEVAEVLVRHSLPVSLNGITSMTPEVARVLAEFKGGILGLARLFDVSQEVADLLGSNLRIVFAHKSLRLGMADDEAYD